MKELLPFVLCSAVLLLAACGSPGKPAKVQPVADSPVAAMLRAHQLDGRVVLVEFGTIGCELSGVGLDSMAEWQRRNAIPGLALSEMKNSHKATLCCGAGGGRMWLDEKLGTRINHARLQQAVDTGAKGTAVACPFCNVMLNNAVGDSTPVKTGRLPSSFPSRSHVSRTFRTSGPVRLNTVGGDET